MSLLAPRAWPKDPAGLREYTGTVFDSIAGRYDLVARLLSFGLDARWRAKAIDGIPQGSPATRLLDLASGTGAFPLMLRARGFQGRIVCLERSWAMIGVAGRRCGGRPFTDVIQGDLLELPFAAGSFDVVTVGYGLRYVASIRQAMRAVYAMLRPGGLFIALEFGRPRNRLHRSATLAYLFLMGTLWGTLLHGRIDTYRHIVESLRAYPGQEFVKETLLTEGFTRVEIREHLGGISTIISGVKV